jgi:hypothetical protein
MRVSLRVLPRGDQRLGIELDITLQGAGSSEASSLPAVYDRALAMRGSYKVYVEEGDVRHSVHALQAAST